MREDFVRFRSRYILLDILIIFIAFALIFVAYEATTGISMKSLVKDPILGGIINISMAIAVCVSIILRLNKNQINLKYLIGSNKNIPWLKLSIVFYGTESLCKGIANLTLYCAYTTFPEFTISQLKESRDFFVVNTDSILTTIISYILIFAYVVIVAPIAEEFIFRGVLFHRFVAKWGIVSGVLVTGVLFGVAHVNIYSFAIGITFLIINLIYIQTKSLLVPIVFHAAHNLLAAVGAVLYISFEQEFSIGIDTLWGGILRTAFSIPILIYFINKVNRSTLLPYDANIERNSID